MMRSLRFGIFAFVSLFFTSVLAENEWISVLDGLAGENVPVRVSGLQGEEYFTVELFRPDKSVINFEQQADDFGNASFDIYGLHVRRAGNYEVRILRDFDSVQEWRRSFRIFAGPVSAYQSQIKINDPSIAADGQSPSRFMITLEDAFGNPIPGRNVKVFSTRNEDNIKLDQQETNHNGQIQGVVFSDTPGVSTISVLSGEVLLFEKPEIVFHLSDTSMENVGSNSGLGGFLKAQLFDEEATSEISYFSLEGLPSEAMVDDNLTITVGARDENGEIVKNYLGTVRFSSSDVRAKLPADYTFKEEDQGEHTFYLAVTFSTPGSQNISVHDLSNYEVSSEERTIQVVSGGGPIVVDPEEKKLTMVTPTPGSVKTDKVTVSGEVAGCDTIKITDGPIELINDLTPEEDGSYVYQTPRLADGTHKFKAFCATDETLATEEVSITVDRSPPMVVTVNIEPPGVLEKNTEFTVKVGADEPLSEVKCVFNEILTELEQQGDIFVGTFVTPNEEGEYPLNCTVADLMGNSKEEPDSGPIVVGKPEDHSAPTDPVTPPVEPPTPVKPTAISSFQAENGNERVTLYWARAVSENPIDHYRINYNECGKELTIINETPDNRTQWYVDHLIPCQKYCFKVTAIDEMGEESVSSNEVEGTPICPESQQKEQAGDTSPSAGTPIQKLWMPFLVAFMAGLIVLGFTRKRP